MRKRLPYQTFPIATDPAGNYICLQFKIELENPTVIFWDHEGVLNENDDEVYETEFIANSFDEFLDQLYREDNDDVFDLNEFEILD